MTLCREGGACLSSTVRKKSQNGSAFSTDENFETLESSAINDGLSMVAMILTVLYMVEGLQTEHCFCFFLRFFHKKIIVNNSVISTSYFCIFLLVVVFLLSHSSIPV